MDSETRVLIIGAGAAGLTAARELSAAGVKVILIEARNRVGGRIYTHHDSVLPVEFGAEFVHGQHPELLQIIETSGAPLYDVTNRHWYFENGELSDYHNFWSKLNAVMALMNPGEPDCSFQDFLDSLPNDEATLAAKDAATRYVQGFHAGTVDRIGVHGLIETNEAEDEINGDHAFRVLGGYDVVANTLFQQSLKQGAVIKLNTIVKELRWSRNQVEAVCVGGKRLQRFSGSHAVITLPLGVLQAKDEQRGAVRFVPELPKSTQAAIENIAMGQAARVILEFRRRFWDTLELPGIDSQENSAQLGFLHYPEAPIPSWWTQLPVRAPVLVGWVGGPKAEEFVGRGADYAVAQAMGSLSQIFGVSENDLEELLLAFYFHDWGADPFARGAYSYLPVNGGEAQSTLAQSIDETIYFAGEATSVGHIGTVHGAVTSGHRAANEILASVRPADSEQ